ncbi:hypothetical protein AcidC75_02390 [Acidisoma sp. C75]
MLIGQQRKRWAGIEAGGQGQTRHRDRPDPLPADPPQHMGEQRLAGEQECRLIRAPHPPASAAREDDGRDHRRNDGASKLRHRRSPLRAGPHDRARSGRCPRYR